MTGQKGKNRTNPNVKIQMTIEIQMSKCQSYSETGISGLAMRLPRRLDELGLLS
jgi:hypothetical protein